MESEIRVGTVLDVNPLPKARKPAFVLTIDFGPEGTKKSSAQITDLYRPEQLQGKQAFVNRGFSRQPLFAEQNLVGGELPVTDLMKTPNQFVHRQ